MVKKVFLLGLTLGFTFLGQAFGFDSEKMDNDVTTLAAIMQMAASDQNYGRQPSMGLYLENFGLIMNMQLYTYRGGQQVVFVDKNNEEFMRVLEVYLPTIRQLKEKDRIIMVIDSQGGMQKTTTVQLNYKDILDLREGKIKREEFKERIEIGENVCAVGESPLDSKKLRMDASLIGSLLRQMVNPTHHGGGYMDQPFYLSGYGLVILSCVYPARSDTGLFSKGDEEFRRLVSQFLPTIRQLKRTDQIVIAIKTPHSQPARRAIISVKNHDLIAFQEGKLSLEEMMEKVILNEGSCYVKN